MLHFDCENICPVEWSCNLEDFCCSSLWVRDAGRQHSVKVGFVVSQCP